MIALTAGCSPCSRARLPDRAHRPTSAATAIPCGLQRFATMSALDEATDEKTTHRLDVTLDIPVIPTTTSTGILGRYIDQ
jgi:hypothetical protein